MNTRNIKILSNRKNKGFGLVEIMISLIIIGSIVSIVLWKSMSATSSSNEMKTQELISSIFLHATTLNDGKYSADLSAKIVTNLAPEFRGAANAIKTPFGNSNVTFTAAADDAGGVPRADRGYDLIISNIPSNSCYKIAKVIEQSGSILGTKINDVQADTDLLKTNNCNTNKVAKITFQL